MSTQSIDELVLNLPKAEQVIVKKLRALILECLPKATEKLDGVLVYRHHRMICYIWPPSAQWGSIKKGGGVKKVTLGFCQGYRMSNADGALLAEGRKQVYCMYFASLAEINEKQIRALLYEAELVDEGFREKKLKSTGFTQRAQRSARKKRKGS